MIIADTSIWIEHLRARDPIRTIMPALIEERKIFALEWIFGELLQGSRTLREESIILGYWNNLPKIDIDEIWIKAGILSSRGKWSSKGVGLIDLAIATAGKLAQYKIWTLDKKLQSVLTKNELFQI